MAFGLMTGVGGKQFKIQAVFRRLLFSAVTLAVTATGASAEAPCPAGNAGLTLPKGFCATVFADDLGAPRHIVVAPDGTVYANNRRRSGGAALLALKDTKGDGHADIVRTFGPPGGGGTGIGIYKDWLYVEIGDEIVR